MQTMISTFWVFAIFMQITALFFLFDYKIVNTLLLLTNMILILIAILERKNGKQNE